MALLLTILFVWFPASPDDAPSVEQIIRRAIEARKAQNDKELKFTWREEHEYRDEQDRPLEPFHRTFEFIMLEGSNYKKLVLLDGQPLDAAMQKRVDEDMAKDRELRRKHSFLNKTVPFGSLEQLERLFDNRVTGEETVSGRATWRVESEPRHGAKATTRSEQETLCTRRTTWCDKEKGVELRHRVVYFKGIHNIRAGTLNEIEWGKVGEHWLPVSSYFRVDVSPGPGFHSRANVRARIFEYQRYMVESNIVPVPGG